MELTNEDNSHSIALYRSIASLKSARRQLFLWMQFMPATTARRGREELTEPDLLRSVLSELLLTFLFVFVGVSAAATAGE